MKERRVGQSEYRRQAGLTSEQLRFLSATPYGAPATVDYSSNRNLWIHRPASSAVFKSLFQAISEAFEPQTWRRASSPLHVTMVKPHRQLLPGAFDTLKEAEVTSLLVERIPSVAHPITLAVDGLRRLGSDDTPFVAIGLSDKRLGFERTEICRTISNQWASPELKWPRFTPHISLAQIYTNRDSRNMMRTIRPLLPDEIQLEPVEVVMGALESQPVR